MIKVVESVNCRSDIMPAIKRVIPMRYHYVAAQERVERQPRAIPLTSARAKFPSATSSRTKTRLPSASVAQISNMSFSLAPAKPALPVGDIPLTEQRPPQPRGALCIRHDRQRRKREEHTGHENLVELAHHFKAPYTSGCRVSSRTDRPIENHTETSFIQGFFRVLSYS
ncbi:hypothetical protein Bsp3421_000118 (plasmid) [Burkholderia sp. FERM BP-3421]|uniref:hypothetical protein n=1 Tax=Burkholderia sp. FERM BP-3421 TaxID=1494466 RepID=UPI00235DEB71|nr:hypothetical protein [Burkholderia sp. FERM BP-3421]WDD90293.1 hypothetical protein Bsp3421_000118 [Burkholderia sp. FERM BP-3421]